MQTDNHVYDELSRLRAENAHLRALLAQHGILTDEPKPMVSKTYSFIGGEG